MKSGFTLIEMSIVLVIIGLIVGGILVGVDLVNAAAIRSQISQIERYNTAVRTFQGKYGYLPGDIPDPYATNAGFAARGTAHPGQGDGNGLIEAWNNANTTGFYSPSDELGAFWVDLSTAGLIDGTFNFATPTFVETGLITVHPASKYFPAGKIGNGNYVYVWSNAGFNYFGLSIPTGSAGAAYLLSSPGLSVQQAYNVDKKVDDGFPQTGSVTATYLNNGVQWAAGGGANGKSNTSATLPTSTTCYDNGGVTGTQNYSTTQNNGTGINCALSFKFQ